MGRVINKAILSGINQKLSKRHKQTPYGSPKMLTAKTVPLNPPEEPTSNECEESSYHYLSEISYEKYVSSFSVSNEITFIDNEVITDINCNNRTTMRHDSVTIHYEKNTTNEPKTIRGFVEYCGVRINYSFIQDRYIIDDNAKWLTNVYDNVQVNSFDNPNYQVYTTLLHDSSSFSKMIVDNKDQEDVSALYLFYESGTHIVKLLPIDTSSIGEAAFRACQNLTNVSIPEGIKNINDLAFSHCRNLNNVIFPSTLENICMFAFEHCDNLLTVSLPYNLKKIGFKAFCECYKIDNIELPNSVETIDGSAFSNCSGLKTITIGTGIKTIGREAFWQCMSLEKVIIKAIVPPELGDMAFIGFADTNSGLGYSEKLKIYVPLESIELYKNANEWSGWGSRIYPIESMAEA